MKTIVVPTDFSAAANNAARYAMYLAKAMNNDVKLCNAFQVPVEAPMAAQVAWPLEDYNSLKKDVDQELSRLAQTLEEEEKAVSPDGSYHPGVSYFSEVGVATDVIRNQAEQNPEAMVIMGLSGAGNHNLDHLVLGSCSKEMIEKANTPLLLVPPKAIFSRPVQIAFATDLSAGDMRIFKDLVTLARPFDAELIVVHVNTGEGDNTLLEQTAQSFVAEASRSANYPKIYYREIKSDNVDSGLAWFLENGHLDMLSVIHRHHGWLSRLLNRSHTRKLAAHIRVPLLVFPQVS